MVPSFCFVQSVHVLKEERMYRHETAAVVRTIDTGQWTETLQREGSEVGGEGWG